MGNFTIEIKAVGAHGCDRTKGDGEEVYGCVKSNCVDCLTTAFAQQLAHAGATLHSATLTHDPGTTNVVVDTIHLAGAHNVNRAHRTRAGEFAEAKAARSEREAVAKAKAEEKAEREAAEAAAAKVRAEAEAKAQAAQALADKVAFDAAVKTEVDRREAERETVTAGVDDVGEVSAGVIQEK